MNLRFIRVENILLTAINQGLLGLVVKRVAAENSGCLRCGGGNEVLNGN